MKVEKYRVLGELIETNKRQFVIPVYQTLLKIYFKNRHSANGKTISLLTKSNA